MYSYQMYNKASKEREAYRQNVEKRLKKALRGAADSKHLSDFPSVCEYLTARFPKIDISDVPIHVISPGGFKNAGWSSVGGLFIPWLGTILVKDGSLGTDATSPRGAFEKILSQYQLNASVEDIVVHECLHAISHRSGRSGFKYRHMEEEFVYTNCIDFYQQRGMTIEQIVDGNFLPFCIQDVMQNRQDMNQIVQVLINAGVTKAVKYFEFDRDARRKIENTNAQLMVDKIIELAREKGRYMVECYNHYGQGLALPASGEPENSCRFMNMDCGI